MTFAPADSSCSLASSASAFDTDSFIAFGNELVSSLDSFSPKDVNSRIIRKTVSLFERSSSDGTSCKIRSNVVCSSLSFFSELCSPIAGDVAKLNAAIGAVEVSTPKVSSICFTSSVASNNVIDFNFSIISVT